MRPTFHHSASAARHQMVPKLFRLFRRHWAFELWLYCWVKFLHFAQCCFLTCKRKSDKSQRKVSDERVRSIRRLSALLYQTPRAKLPPEPLPLSHGADAQILTLKKEDIRSSVALGAQDPCFHKSFLSLDGRKFWQSLGTFVYGRLWRTEDST